MQTLALDQNITLEMVPIPGGTFTMGSPEAELKRFSNEGPQHEVALATFFMGRYPITQAQWRAVASLPQVERELDPDPSNFKGDKRPVEQVNWYEAIEFCDRLSAHTGQLYTLPSEGQWEYACRACTTTSFYFGETISPELANFASNQTTPVDHFPCANAWGLLGMHGNVWEWCLDHWHDNYNGAPTDGTAWVIGGDNNHRVMRGGSWTGVPRYCRSASRGYHNPDSRYYLIGFRVVSVPPRTLG